MDPLLRGKRERRKISGGGKLNPGMEKKRFGQHGLGKRRCTYQQKSEGGERKGGANEPRKPPQCGNGDPNQGL